MPRGDRQQRKYVCVFRGSRDAYQTAAALAEAGKLKHLVTDFYSPDILVESLGKLPAPGLEDFFTRRHSTLLPSRYVRGVPTAILRLGRDWSRVDARLGAHAAKKTTDAAVVYSYYWPGFVAANGIANGKGPKVVFQVHPPAEQIRKWLTRDRDMSGIQDAKEPEELLNAEDARREMTLIQQADGIICTSQFTRVGLIEGQITRPIEVVPYGAFEESDIRPASVSPTRAAPDQLRLLWVGQLSYRKGPHWLFEALRAVGSERVQLTIVSRDSLPAWLGPSLPNVRHIQAASDKHVRSLMRTHDLFVMPSLIEGFGLVYLEALSQGLPILATPNSGAPDIARHGSNAVIVPPSDAVAIAEALQGLMEDETLLHELRRGASRSQNSLPSWRGFRHGVAQSLERIESTVL